MTSYDFSAVFEEAEEAGFGSSGDLGVGKYTATIVSANASESQAGDPKLGFLFKAIEGSEDADGQSVGGETIWLNLTFSENGGKYAARDAKALGLTDAMLNADPDEAVEVTVGQEWKIKVVLSKDGKWTNVYLQKRLDEDDEDEDEEPKPKKKSKAKAKAKPKSKKKAKPEPEPEDEDEDEAEEDDDDDDNGWDI